MKQQDKTQPLRIEIERIKRVRSHTIKSKQSICGFIALAIDEKIERDIQNIKAADVVRVLFNLH